MFFYMVLHDLMLFQWDYSGTGRIICMGVNPHETLVQLWVSNEHRGDDQENGTSPAKRYQMAMGERERERESERRISKYL